MALNFYLCQPFYQQRFASLTPKYYDNSSDDEDGIIICTQSIISLDISWTMSRGQGEHTLFTSNSKLTEE